MTAVNSGSIAHPPAHGIQYSKLNDMLCAMARSLLLLVGEIPHWGHRRRDIRRKRKFLLPTSGSSADASFMSNFPAGGLSTTSPRLALLVSRGDSSEMTPRPPNLKVESSSVASVTSLSRFHQVFGHAFAHRNVHQPLQRRF